MGKEKYLSLISYRYIPAQPSSINRAGGLYGRILMEDTSTDGTQSVCTHDRGQDSSIQTDLAWLIRCLLYGKSKSNLICLMSLVCTN